MSVKEFSIHPLSAFLFSLIAWTGVILFTGMLMGMAVGAAIMVAGKLALLWQITHAAARCESIFGSADIAAAVVER
jgi:hypothetical protein